MIFTVLFTIVVNVVVFILALFPDLPATPRAIVDIANFLLTFLTSAFGFIMHIYTPVLAAVVVSLTLALMFFNQGYVVVVWILKRLHLWK